MLRKITINYRGVNTVSEKNIYSAFIIDDDFEINKTVFTDEFDMFSSSKEEFLVISAQALIEVYSAKGLNVAGTRRLLTFDIACELPLPKGRELPGSSLIQHTSGLPK